MVEDVHFRLDDPWATPAEIGQRALAAALSDLAAMGARPGEAYVALGLPSRVGEAEALELIERRRGARPRAGRTIAGGDVVAAQVLFACVTAVGWVDRRRSSWAGTAHSPAIMWASPAGSAAVLRGPCPGWPRGAHWPERAYTR